MQKTKVENIQNNSGRAVVNQFVIYTPEGRYFQSYACVIAFVPLGGGQILIDSEKWDYSTTTGKYRNIFLGETKAETTKKLNEGIYKFAELN
jgi:hypothetical protein